MQHFIELVFAGLFAGLVNSVAGGGGLFTYPLLLSLGVAPIMANATATAAIWPGALSSAYGYKKALRKIPKSYFWLLLPSVVGSIIGAIILKKTSNHNFALIAPWLIILGVFLIATQPIIRKWLIKEKRKSRRIGLFALLTVIFAIFLVSIYGGYFGVGYGIIMLALLGFTRLKDLNQMNGLKNFSGGFVNLVATIYFAANSLIHWQFVWMLLIGTIIGGYVGAKYSTRLPAHLIRTAIIVIGLVIAVVLVVKYKAV